MGIPETRREMVENLSPKDSRSEEKTVVGAVRTERNGDRAAGANVYSCLRHVSIL